MLKVSDILGFINKIAPPDLAESWDNPGLQVGNPVGEVNRIMVALDPSPPVIEAAITSHCNLLVTHHPLIFKPLSSISTATPHGKTIHDAIKNKLSIIALHTNYDIAEGGLNDVLAQKIGLFSCLPLQTTSTQQLIKLVIYVPTDHLHKVRGAMLPFAEKIGKYSDCSFAADGQGTFTPLSGAAPFIGSEGVLEQVAEERLELLVDRAVLSRALKKLHLSHPYEEPAFDIYPLLNEGRSLGLGRIGRLSSSLPLAAYAARLATILRAPGLRYVGEPATMITKVALCSGSGASLIKAAKRAGADLLITGDLKYHEARDAEDLGMAVIDAGHFPTEIIMVDAVAGQLKRMISESGDGDCEVMQCDSERDPFQFCSQKIYSSDI
ncbi:MAG: Nif3-like dinuclear metal center hexameric protein [Geobacteraceae bacterium GWC2_48_7]|nr:MAG: Nif3-like dinuclear metal center hexameric protein [Geobacteraceae bacterium GWC2_48_7]